VLKCIVFPIQMGTSSSTQASISCWNTFGRQTSIGDVPGDRDVHKSNADEKVGGTKDGVHRRCRTMGRSNSLRFTGDQELSWRPPYDKVPKERHQLAACLKNHPNLKRLALSDNQIDMLVDGAFKVFVEPGEVVMSEGDLDNATFFVVIEGSMEVVASEPFEIVQENEMAYLSRSEEPPKPEENWKKSSKPKTIRRMNAIASYGESSMTFGTPRWATVTALERSVVWVFSQSNFKIVQHKGSHAPSVQKTKEDELLIATSLQENHNLQRLTPLTYHHLQMLVSVAWKEVVAQGATFMQEGDLTADALYIVGEGSFEFNGTEPFEVVSKGKVGYLARAAHTGDTLPKNASSRTVQTVGRGICFGEISMLYCAPRFATVKALEPSVLWAIDRSSFIMVQMKAAEDEIKDRVKYLNQLEALNAFSTEDKEKFAGVMDCMRWTKGEKLSLEGPDGNSLCILYEGSVASQNADSAQQVLEADRALGIVHLLGARSLTGSTVASDDLVVRSDFATGLVLSNDEFAKIWDRLIEAAPAPTFTRYTTSVSKEGHQHNKLTLDSFKTVGLLGCSALGPVSLCQHKSSGALYALKSMSKGLIVQKGLRKSILREKMLWMEVISPFIIRAIATFNSPQTLSFLLEPALGGDLARACQQYGLFGSNQHTRYYTASVILALEHLHKRRIVYRNLKLENILVSEKGCPKLTDFSLAKLVVGHTFTTCGTPEYMAPEVLAGIGHNRAVDWWALGVLAFQLMVGYSPFRSEHPMEVYSNIMCGISRVAMPQAIPPDLRNLITALLAPAPIDRLPMRQGGIKNVMDHSWFENFEWQRLRTETMDPPFVPPSVKNAAGHLSMFSAKEGDLPRPVDYVACDSGWDFEFATQ